MTTAALRDYLAQLAKPARPDPRMWLNDHGQAEGRFFNCSLTSAFQPLRETGTGRTVAYEAVVRHVDEHSANLSLWRMLDQAASDDESVELDRLCRMLHAINFFRQSDAADSALLVNVHNRLLSSVSSNHGYAFRRILDALELPVERIVLQLPEATPGQRWLLGYVSDNYKRNGMRMAMHLPNLAAARDILSLTQPALARIHASAIGSDVELHQLLALTGEFGVQLVVKHIDTAAQLALVARVSAAAGAPVWTQGSAVGGKESRVLGRSYGHSQDSAHPLLQRA